MKMDNRLAAAGVMVGLFLSGAVTGGVAVHLFEDPGVPAQVRRDADREGSRRGSGRDDDRRGRRPGDPRSFATTRVVERLSDRLELTAEQRDSVQAILERQREAASAVFQEMGPRLRAMVDSTNTRIRRLLDPVQQERFDELLRTDRGVLGRPPPSARDSAR